MAFVNLKPILPGHVLVTPQRVVDRFKDLTDEEVTDLYKLVQRVGNVVEKAFDCSSLTISMQDGKDAGMSVYHVHVHIVPRKAGDYLNNDDIYKDMQKNEKEIGKDKFGVDNEDRKARSLEEMIREAEWLASLMKQ